MKPTEDFIFGRYEAGKENNKVVVKKNKPVYNEVKWGNGMTDLAGGAVELARNFINDKSYKNKMTSTLVYGIQWDTTLQFFNDQNYLKNSQGKGWYNTTLHNTGVDMDANASNKVKNIYDMAGNIREWTMEAHTTERRVLRGGDYHYAGSDQTVSTRYDTNGITSPSNYFGFRVTLFLNLE